MRILIAALLFLISAAPAAAADGAARARAARLGTGMNLSYLDQWWNGTREKRFVDFAKPEEAARREKMFADIARAGFKTVRIPVNFGAWAGYDKPFRWENAAALKMADDFVKWALANDLNAIIDLHHVEFDGSVPGAATTERLVWLWREIALRYRATNPEKVFFELRNEPHDIPAETWRAQAAELIRTVRAVAPRHTLVVGFHDWNSRAALLASEPFADPNIIYTFHYYDPFVFTHQGATWSGPGFAEIGGVPFPWNPRAKLDAPATAQGKWPEGLLRSYERDSSAEKMFADLKLVKEWSEKHRVPVFAGEFGSFTRFAAEDDRCRHAATVYAAFGKLKIPNAWWEWDGGFNMFKKDTTEIAECMRKAIDAFGRP